MKPRLVKIEGHSKKLYVCCYQSSCGSIKNGIAFYFEGEGGWVVDLKDLKKIVSEAESKKP